MRKIDFDSALLYIMELDLDKYLNRSTANIENGGYNWDIKTATIARDRYKGCTYA